MVMVTMETRNGLRWPGPGFVWCFSLAVVQLTESTCQIRSEKQSNLKLMLYEEFRIIIKAWTGFQSHAESVWVRILVDL